MATTAPEAPMSGWVFVLFAVVFGALAILFGYLELPDLVTIAMLAVAGLLAFIGAVAIGVTAGTKRVDWIRQRRA